MTKPKAEVKPRPKPAKNHPWKTTHYGKQPDSEKTIPYRDRMKVRA